LGLSKRKRAFIAAYCEDPKMGQADAARKAGYSIKRAKQAAYELMRDVDVKREIERQQAAKYDASVEVIAKAAKNSAVSRGSLCQQCDEVIEQCTSAGPGSWQMQSRLKAIELKAKLYGLLTEKVELGLDDKLVELLESGRKRAGIVAVSAEPVIKGELIGAAN